MIGVDNVGRMLKKNNKENKLLSAEELMKIKNRINDLKEESSIILSQKPNKRGDFERIRKIGIEMSILQKRLKKGLKNAKKEGI